MCPLMVDFCVSLYVGSSRVSHSGWMSPDYMTASCTCQPCPSSTTPLDCSPSTKTDRWVSSLVTQCGCHVWSHSVGVITGHSVWVSCLVTQCGCHHWSLSVGVIAGHSMWVSSLVTQCGCHHWSLSVGVIAGHSMWVSSLVTQCGCHRWSFSVGVIAGQSM